MLTLLQAFICTIIFSKNEAKNGYVVGLGKGCGTSKEIKDVTKNVPESGGLPECSIVDEKLALLQNIENLDAIKIQMYGTWTTWSTWTRASGNECVGVDTKERTCIKEENQTCPGSKLVTRKTLPASHCAGIKITRIQF